MRFPRGAASDAARGSQEAEQAVRTLFPRYHGRVHHHAAGRPAGVQGDPGDRLSRVPRRPPRRTGARGRHRRHTAFELFQNPGDVATSRKSSTATAAPNRAACRSPPWRRRFWCRKSRSKRKPSRTTARRCSPNPPAWRTTKEARNETPPVVCGGVNLRRIVNRLLCSRPALPSAS